MLFLYSKIKIPSEPNNERFKENLQEYEKAMKKD